MELWPIIFSLARQ